MVSPQNGTPTLSRTRAYLFTGVVLLGLAAFGALFVMVDQFYYAFASARFPSVGDSPWLATLWGIVSRAHLVVLAAPFVIRWPRLLGFQVGKTAQYGRMLLVMLLANCGVIAAYLWLTGATTPYSGDQWLVTEAIIVPVVEETIWRGLVLTILLGLLRALHSENASVHLAVWFGGLTFGMLHLANALAGVPALFAAIQALNAVVWGVVYGYARAKTESLWPSMVLHAAMNIVVVLF
ncbi:MAG: hypothetical protein A2Z66_14095 [Chloroflexi bacterium RBG_13_66_10]|nr:MAG: hypothetical protein A2Z66_14095 [Chloroflexi bacterium RBG_13_66_10]